MKHLGDYTLSSDHTVIGELTVKGARTRLRVHSAAFMPGIGTGGTITGIAYSGEYLTLIDCRSPPIPTTHNRDGNIRFELEIFPHHVAIGRRHIDPHSAVIDRIEFDATDLDTLFYDFDAFGTVIDSDRIIDFVLEERRKLRPVESGNGAIVAYFSGKDEIISVPTVIGTVSAMHTPHYSLGGPSGVYIRNHMAMSIVPDAPIIFETAMARVSELATFLSFAAGRAQGVESIRMSVQDDRGGGPSHIEIHPSFPWKLRGKDEQFTPQPSDIPLSPILRPDEFRNVLSNWFRRHATWRLARSRYSGCLKKTNRYGAERLVAAANMFDLLPKDAVAVDRTLPPDLVAARNESLEKFSALPKSIDREAALNALKRLGHPSLPKKVTYRVEKVVSKLGNRFEELGWVASIATKCRNVFVHGDNGELDMAKIEPFIPFLTDTLEFVFASSDFIEAGWDAAAWLRTPVSSGHSFARYRHEYAGALTRLKVALVK